MRVGEEGSSDGERRGGERERGLMLMEREGEEEEGGEQ